MSEIRRYPLVDQERKQALAQTKKNGGRIVKWSDQNWYLFQVADEGYATLLAIDGDVMVPGVPRDQISE